MTACQRRWWFPALSHSSTALHAHSPSYTTSLRKMVRHEGKWFASCQMRRRFLPENFVRSCRLWLSTWYPKLWGNGCSHQCRQHCMVPYVLNLEWEQPGTWTSSWRFAYLFLTHISVVLSRSQEQVLPPPTQLLLLERKRRNINGFCHLAALGSCIFWWLDISHVWSRDFWFLRCIIPRCTKTPVGSFMVCSPPHSLRL